MKNGPETSNDDADLEVAAMEAAPKTATPPSDAHSPLAYNFFNQRWPWGDSQAYHEALWEQDRFPD